MEWFIAVLVSIGTFMQFLLKIFDWRDNTEKREAIRWSVAEDELVAELRPWRRRAARRELRRIRTPEIDSQIRRINLSMVSWLILVAASGAATMVADMPW